ncbi:hypothetical protein C8J56DRAFT_1166894 [Mycena floridula]|nr:hypothetical protein C8J56DRAFT_1166894 [Mycena floridula]
MNSDAMQPFPELPFEIVCLIIGAMVEIEPKRALELVCLSRDIQPIVERALHRYIVLKDRPAADSFLEMLKLPRRPDTLRNQTKLESSIIPESFSSCIWQIHSWFAFSIRIAIKSLLRTRIVIAIEHHYRLTGCEHYIRQWGRRMNGEELDMWEEAEEIVKVQRAKITTANHLHAP